MSWGVKDWIVWFIRDQRMCSEYFYSWNTQQEVRDAFKRLHPYLRPISIEEVTY